MDVWQLRLREKGIASDLVVSLFFSSNFFLSI